MSDNNSGSNNNSNQMSVVVELAIFTLVGAVLSSIAGYLANSPTLTVAGIALSVVGGLASGMTSLQAYLKGQQAAIGLNQSQTPINLQVNTPQAGNETTNISQGKDATTVTAKPASQRTPPGPPPVSVIMPPPTYPLDREG